MRDYIITVNSTVDMPKEWLAERGVPGKPATTFTSASSAPRATASYP